MSDDLIRFSTSAPPSAAINPEAQGAANFITANAYTLLALALMINDELAKRLKVHFAAWTNQSNVNDPDTPFRVLIHTSPNVFGIYGAGHHLRCALVLSAGRYDSASKPDPIVYVDVIDVTDARGGSPTSPPVVHNTHRDSNVGPDNYWHVEIDINLDASVGEPGRDRTYEVQILTQQLCQIVACTIYEVPRRALTVADGDARAPMDPFFIGAHVYAGPMAEVYDALRRVFNRQGSVFFAWAPMDSSRAAQVTAASATNLWDANTAWDAAAFGFWCWPEHQGTLDSDDVDVVVWAIVDPGASGSGPTMGALTFEADAATIGRLDVQNYQAFEPTVVVALQTKWPGAAALASAKVDVLGAYAGATQMTVLSCGMYAKVPLDPRSLDDLAVWLRAGDLALADTDPVASWADASGNGNDAAQASAGLRPTFVADAISGRPAVRFDGVDDVLAIADSASFKGAELSVFVVARVTATNADMLVVGYPHAGTHTAPFFRWALELHNTTGIDLIVAADVESLVKDFSTRTLMRAWTYCTAQRRLHRDGDEVNVNAASPPSITYPTAVGLRIGADVAGGSPFGGDIAELLIYTRQLSNHERQEVEEYLSEKYGLQRGPT